MLRPVLPAHRNDQQGSITRLAIGRQRHLHQPERQQSPMQDLNDA
jgi:hypothetical protein